MAKGITNRTVTLYHVTPSVNRFPVEILGLQSDFSSGRKGVFLVAKSRIGWAIKHTSDRTGLPASELMVVTVAVRRSSIRRVTWRTVARGVWRHVGDIFPCRIKGFSQAVEL